MLVIICTKYGKNPSRTVVFFFFKVKAEKFQGFFFHGQGRKIQKFAKNSNFQILKKTVTRDTP